MTTKITLDPALVRSVLRLEYEIDMHFDEDLGIIEYGKKDDCYDGTSINIHEFKDKAIEWCAGKGYLISPSVISLDGLKIEIHKAHRHVDDDYSPHNWYMSSYLVEYFMHRDYPDKLSAELAAISFVWEQNQKEKKR